MSVNIPVDTIFVGQWIGSLAIAAVTVVSNILYFIVRMAIGIGGGSVLSRALVQKTEKAKSLLLTKYDDLFGVTFLCY
jgi:Na+-driven multidrug efflux pump